MQLWVGVLSCLVVGGKALVTEYSGGCVAVQGQSPVWLMKMGCTIGGIGSFNMGPYTCPAPEMTYKQECDTSITLGDCYIKTASCKQTQGETNDVLASFVIDCGQDALMWTRLVTCGVGKAKPESKCCPASKPLAPPPLPAQTLYSTCEPIKGKTFETMSLLTVTCPANTVLSSFRLTGGCAVGEMRYIYVCIYPHGATSAPATVAPPTATPTLSPPTAVPPTGAPPTVAPPTIAPPTVSPPTVTPTTVPLTIAPPTVSPPTVAPPTGAPPTVAPPTAVPLTIAPPTASPPTVAPLTAVPPTVAPLTAAPDTSAPPTKAPPTAAPLTAAPDTSAPPTAAPLTAAPPTVAPPTAVPQTISPPTIAPPTAVPLTKAPVTAVPPTPAPATVSPPTAAPRTTAPVTPAPLTRSPPTSTPSSVAPPTLIPPTAEPRTAVPATAAPPTSFPSTAVPSTSAPHTRAPPTVTVAPPTAIPLVPTPVPISTSAPATAAPTLLPAPSLPLERSVTETLIVEHKGFTGTTKKAYTSFKKTEEVAAVGSVAVVVGSASGGPSASKLAAIGMALDCMGDQDHGDGLHDEEDLPWLIHPTGIRIQGSPHAGAIVGNTLLGIASGLLFTCLTGGTLKWAVGWAGAARMWRHPSVMGLVPMFLFPGTLQCIVELLFYPRNVSITLLAVVGLAPCAAFIYALWYIGKESCFNSTCVPTETGKWQKYFLGSAVWQSKEGTDHTERLGLFFDVYSDEQDYPALQRGRYILIEVGHLIPLIIGSVVRAGTHKTCALKSFGLGGVMMVYLATAMVYRPFLAPFMNQLVIWMAALPCAGLMFVGIGFWTGEDSHACLTMGIMLLNAAMFLAMVRTVYELVTWLMDMRSGSGSNNTEIEMDRLNVSNIDLNASNMDYSVLGSSTVLPPSRKHSYEIPGIRLEEETSAESEISSASGEEMLFVSHERDTSIVLSASLPRSRSRFLERRATHSHHNLSSASPESLSSFPYGSPVPLPRAHSVRPKRFVAGSKSVSPPAGSSWISEGGRGIRRIGTVNTSTGSIGSRKKSLRATATKL